MAIHLVELSLRLLVVMRHRRRRTLASPRCRRRRTTAWFVAILQLLERDITIDMLDYTSLSSSMPKSLHCKSRQDLSQLDIDDPTTTMRRCTFVQKLSEELFQLEPLEGH